MYEGAIEREMKKEMKVMLYLLCHMLIIADTQPSNHNIFAKVLNLIKEWYIMDFFIF